MISLTDTNFRSQLFPFTHTRHAADIPVGILTIRQKWELLTGEEINTLPHKKNISIPANIIPTLQNFTTIIEEAGNGSSLMETEEIKIFHHAAHLFQLNDFALRKDFELLTKNKTSAKLSSTNIITGIENIFVEEGAVAENCMINAATGPVYIGKNVQLMEGCMIRGPFSIGENSVLKMGTKIYGATSIGANCVAGGEIKNSILFDHSNKAHDGYLGDSVVGEWCNLGAGTSNSNVKNTGGRVGYQTEFNGAVFYAGNKGGLLMGDYSRAAINTSFNTGSVVGVCCNIFGEKYPDKYTENFTWGNDTYIFEKAVNDIDNWKKMKGKHITPQEKEMLNRLYHKL